MSHDPAECARFHVNRHSTKMVLEYAQLLSTAHRVLDGTIIDRLSPSGRKQKAYVLADNRESALYSATHINHPSAIWVRKTHQNYIWLTELLEELCCEYTYRYEKTHKVERDGLLKVLRTNLPKNIPIGPFTAPTPAMPDDVKVPGNSLASYRNYYRQNKTHLADWKNRPVPQWFQG